MEKHFDNLKNVVDENKALRERLKGITQQNKKLDKKVQSKQIKFLGLLPFMEKNEKFSEIDTAQHAMEKNEITKAKLDIIRTRLQEKEEMPCSFAPAINKSSTEIVEKTNYIPVHKRPLPKQGVKTTQKIVNLEQEPEDETPKKLDPEFYRNQFEWRQQIERHYQAQRAKLQEDELKEAVFVPMNTQQIKRNIVERKIMATQNLEANKTQQRGKSKKRMFLKKKPKVGQSMNSGEDFDTCTEDYKETNGTTSDIKYEPGQDNNDEYINVDEKEDPKRLTIQKAVEDEIDQHESHHLGGVEVSHRVELHEGERHSQYQSHEIAHHIVVNQFYEEKNDLSPSILPTAECSDVIDPDHHQLIRPQEVVNHVVHQHKVIHVNQDVEAPIENDDDNLEVQKEVIAYQGHKSVHVKEDIAAPIEMDGDVLPKHSNVHTHNARDTDDVKEETQQLSFRDYVPEANAEAPKLHEEVIDTGLNYAGEAQEEQTEIVEQSKEVLILHEEVIETGGNYDGEAQDDEIETYQPVSAKANLVENDVRVNQDPETNPVQFETQEPESNQVQTEAQEPEFNPVQAETQEVSNTIQADSTEAESYPAQVESKEETNQPDPVGSSRQPHSFGEFVKPASDKSNEKPENVNLNVSDKPIDFGIESGKDCHVELILNAPDSARENYPESEKKDHIELIHQNNENEGSDEQLPAVISMRKANESQKEVQQEQVEA